MNKISIVLMFILLSAYMDAAAQQGACCVELDCVGTMTEEECLILGGNWFENEDCDAGFDCESTYPCGHYIIGDFNGNGAFNIADIVAAFSKLRTGSPDAALLCECPPGSGNIWAVAFDLNGSCNFNLADVILACSRRLIPEIPFYPCPQCPPAPQSP